MAAVLTQVARWVVQDPSQMTPAHYNYNFKKKKTVFITIDNTIFKTMCYFGANPPAPAGCC